MQIDEREFFLQSTLRICGSLDVEVFLKESFAYLSKYIPADEMHLSYFKPETGEVVMLARATGKGCTAVNLSLTLPREGREYIQRPLQRLETIIYGRAEEHPTARHWIAKGVFDRNASMMVLRLILNNVQVGAVIFLAHDSNTFIQRHADLITLLRGPFAIALSNSIRYAELLRIKELLAEDNRFLHSELRQVAGEDVVGADFGLKSVMEMARQVAPLSSLVMLLGETGTGKEVIANAIHSLSPRKDKSLIKVNCGAIHENLIDSELFGHEKGAFTGAISRKRGRFERADGGTIFLDEVGELKPEAQVRLLRVLQEKEIERAGGTESIKVDIRVIAATHRDMEEMVKDGTLREDLYFRLRVFPISIPPLRDRKGDIPSLVQHFMLAKSREMGLKGIPTLAPGALEQLMTYHWPGNVRELENIVERTLILSKGEPLAFNDLQVPLKTRQLPSPEVETGPESEDPLSLDEVMSRYIRKVLGMTGGRIGGEEGAANLLQINPSTLRKRMRKLGIPFGRKA